MFSLKKFFINKTQREGLFYLLVDGVIFKFNYWQNYLINGHLFRQIRINYYLKNNSKIKLHIGCGSNCIKGFLNTDIFGKVPIDITKKLPFKDETLNLIYSNHVIEHIYLKDFKFFLKESFRVLDVGGKQIIQMPSIEKISKLLYSSNSKENVNFLLNHHKIKYSLDNEVYPSNFINDIMHIFFQHKYLYDFDFLNYLCKNAGFKKIQKLSNFDLLDLNLNKFLNQKNTFKNCAEFKFWDLTTETFLLIK